MVYRRNLINLFFLLEFVYLGISHPLRVVSKSLLMNFLFLIGKRERERERERPLRYGVEYLLAFASKLHL